MQSLTQNQRIALYACRLLTDCYFDRDESLELELDMFFDTIQIKPHLVNKEAKDPFYQLSENQLTQILLLPPLPEEKWFNDNWWVAQNGQGPYHFDINARIVEFERQIYRVDRERLFLMHPEYQSWIAPVSIGKHELFVFVIGRAESWIDVQQFDAFRQWCITLEASK